SGHLERQDIQRNFGADFGHPVGPGTPANPPGGSGLGSGPIGTGTHGTPNNHHGTTGKARNRG
ncbi:polyhydroxyalkanoate synthesis repressor PhaR, partial [Xanthomonas oryzae pv. oryzae]